MMPTDLVPAPEAVRSASLNVGCAKYAATRGSKVKSASVLTAPKWRPPLAIEGVSANFVGISTPPLVSFEPIVFQYGCVCAGCAGGVLQVCEPTGDTRSA